jgi:hypothetical protein
MILLALFNFVIITAFSFRSTKRTENDLCSIARSQLRMCYFVQKV